MTPTRSQLDAALPRVPSGIGAMAGDLTDDDDRAVALDWLERLYQTADGEFGDCYRCGRPIHVEHSAVRLPDEPWQHSPCPTDQNTEDDIQATIEWLRSLRQSRDSAPESPESDENAEQVPVDPGNNTGAHSGSVWPPPLASRRILSTRAYPPAPGITYYSPRTYTDDGGFVVKEFN